MKKYILLFILVIPIIVTGAYGVAADDYQNILDEYTTLYGTEIQEGFDKANTLNDEEDFVLDIEELISEIVKGKKVFSVKDIFLELLMIFLREVRSTLKLLVIIPVIAVLNTYISGAESSFSSKGAAQAAYFVCYSIMAGAAASAFIDAVRCGKDVIENVSVFMRVLIPVSLASLAASGAVISATTFEIVLMSVIEISEFAAEKLFFPFVMVATALNIVNNLSDTLKADKLAQFINKTIRWGIGIMLTLFVGITGLQGIAAGSVDGLTVKLTKFAASNLIPMVGGILAETVETVMNCSTVIKNAVGVAGIIAVIVIAVVPLIKITVCLILFRLCAAVIQPITNERYVKFLSELADSVSTVLAISVSAVVMFVILLTIMINIGNSAVLLGR